MRFRVGLIVTAAIESIKLLAICPSELINCTQCHIENPIDKVELIIVYSVALSNKP